MRIVVPAACLLGLAASSAGAFESLPCTDGGTGPIALGADFIHGADTIRAKC